MKIKVSLLAGNYGKEAFFLPVSGERMQGTMIAGQRGTLTQADNAPYLEEKRG